MGRQHVGRGRNRPPSVATNGQVDGGGLGRNELRLGNLEWTSPTSQERIARRRKYRVLRQARRIIGAALALSLLGGVVFAALLLVTPSVGNAPRLLRNLERTHNSAAADRASPERFFAALRAIQDRQHDSPNGALSGVIAFAGHFLGPSAHQNRAVDQQLASMLYLRNGKGKIAQIERAVLLLKLHWTYSESAIMRMYAAAASFGHGYYGLVAASCGYFGQRPGHLSWAQITLLAAAAVNHATDDPYEHFGRAKRDQAAVLRALAAAGTFSDVQAAKIARQPLHLRGQLAASPRRDAAHSHKSPRTARRLPQTCVSGLSAG
jgi:hypothetical protein